MIRRNPRERDPRRGHRPRRKTKDRDWKLVELVKTRRLTTCSVRKQETCDSLTDSFSLLSDTESRSRGTLLGQSKVTKLRGVRPVETLQETGRQHTRQEMRISARHNSQRSFTGPEQSPKVTFNFAEIVKYVRSSWISAARDNKLQVFSCQSGTPTEHQQPSKC